MNNQSFSPLPIALDPVWSRQDFAYRSNQISQQFEQDGIKSIGLWFEDAANFACVLLACFNANVRVLLPPNILQENQQWIAENADLLLTDENFASFGISQKQPKNRLLFERNNQTEVWLKTSGSSGEAKIIVKTAEQLWLEAETVTQILPFSSEEDVYLTGTVSVQHFYGLTYRVMLPLYRGWVIGRLQHDFPEKLIVDSQRPYKTVWISSPTLLIHLGINHPKLDKFNLIGVVTSGGVHGVIKLLRDKYVELEIAPKVVIKVEKTAIHHGDVELIDAETAKKAGAAVIGAEAENPEETDRLSKQKKTTDIETVEEVVEVDSAAEEGTEIVEEVIEVDENGNEISREKK